MHRRDWKFDASVMEDEEYKNKVKNEIMESLYFLLHAGWKIHFIVVDMLEGCIAPFTLELDVNDMRNAVNFARLWTAEHSPRLDQELLDAISHLSNAYYMLNSSNALGDISSSTCLNVRNDLMSATRCIRKVALEMEYIIDTTTKRKKK
ncbi:MAG: hypothetical protein GWN17_07915 [Candidatus Korarchaeota archaeon]|nr:hypothetical protein [Candidatus Korarchaeota archaeon]